ncbi:ferredoxin [Bacillus sp. ISL-34]|nr:ferredoxin [Bacillus sp. ISL-34]MBT2645487.1 ferredoxin [Bacillus sp. ISL-34]
MAKYTVVDQETCIACGACGGRLSDRFNQSGNFTL